MALKLQFWGPTPPGVFTFQFSRKEIRPKARRARASLLILISFIASWVHGILEGKAIRNWVSMPKPQRHSDVLGVHFTENHFTFSDKLLAAAHNLQNGLFSLQVSSEPSSGSIQ